jgi:excisionase family DNA binding protein
VTDRDILNIDEAAELLGVSIKTFNKVLHHEDMPARKIGREWKFSRRALIEWVGNGRSQDFYRDPEREEGEAEVDGRHGGTRDVELRPQARGNGAPRTGETEKPRARRTVGWQIED